MPSNFYKDPSILSICAPHKTSGGTLFAVSLVLAVVTVVKPVVKPLWSSPCGQACGQASVVKPVVKPLWSSLCGQACGQASVVKQDGPPQGLNHRLDHRGLTTDLTTEA